MQRRFSTALVAAGLTLMAACGGDKEKARERAAEARRNADEAAARAREEAHKLAHEAKQEARNLKRNIQDALNNPGAGQSSSDADRKLRGGEEDLRVAGSEAAAKLDRAALIAKVKARLANEAGLATITSVDVDASGQVVTLRGTVSSPEQKQLAENAARQVSGVRRVIDELQVQP